MAGWGSFDWGSGNWGGSGARVVSIHADGGMSYGGGAGMTALKALAAAGGFLLRGDGRMSGPLSIFAAGGMTFGGTAGMSAIAALAAESGFLLRADGVLDRAVSIWAESGFFLRGDARLQQAHGMRADSGLTQGADARMTALQALAADGGMVFGADAALTFLVLTRASALYYFDALYGVEPVVGGDPVFERESAAALQDRRGRWRSALRQTPRLEHALLTSWPRAELRERPVLALLPARTQKVVRNVGHGANGTAGWSVSGGALSVIDDTQELADVGLLDLVSDGDVLHVVDSGAGGYLQNAGTPGSTAQHALSAFLRGAGTVSLRIGAVSAGDVVLADRYTRAVDQLVTPAAGSDPFRIYFSPGADFYVVLEQMEAGSFSTAPIPNAGASTASRAVEIFHTPGAPRSVAQALYARWEAAMDDDGGLATPVIWALADEDGVAPWLQLYHDGVNLVLELDNGVDAPEVATVAAATAAGQVVEALAVVDQDGAGRLIVSVAEAPPAGADLAAPAAGLPPEAALHVWIGSLDGSRSGALRAAEVKSVRLGDLAGTGDDTRLQRLRDYILGDQGQLLAEV